MKATELEGLERRAREFRERYQRHGDPSDLRTSIELSRTLVANIPTGHEVWPRVVNNLCVSLRLLYEVSGEPEVLNEGIDRVRAAARHPLVGEFRPYCLLTSTVLLRHEFLRAGVLAVFEEAVAAGEEAVHTTGEGHPLYGSALTIVANLYMTGFQTTQAPGLLDNALEMQRTATKRISDDGLDRAIAMNSLANLYRLSHEYTADPTALDEAVHAAREAVANTPPRNHFRPPHECTLATVLLARYDLTGETMALREGAALLKNLADAADGERALSAAFSQTLCVALMELHRRTEDPEILDKAIRVGRALASAQGPMRFHLMNTCVLALLAAYEETGERAHLDEAVTHATAMVDETDAEHPIRSTLLTTLGGALVARYRLDGGVALLESIVRVSREVLDDPGGIQADQPTRHLNLADVLLELYEHTGRRPLLDEARERATTVIGLPRSRPWQLVQGWRLRARAELELGETEEALNAYRQAVASLPRVAPRSAARADRELGIGRVFGLGPEAAGAAIAAGRPGLALELLEHARGVLLNERLASSEALRRVEAIDRRLAEEFRRVREDLDRPEPDLTARGLLGAAGTGTTSPPPVDGDRFAARRRELDDRWTKVLAGIRALPGLSDFLEPPTAEELREAAAEGPVIIVNVDFRGGHALILSGPDDPIHVERLAGVTPHTVGEQIARLPDETGVEDGDLDDVLRWCWDLIAGPALAAAGITTAPDDPERRPRVWWCPTGPATFLPLHAAGHHDRPGHSVMDLAVPSYTPTVRALRHARRRTVPMTGEPVPLVVAMPRTPGAVPLSGASAEAEQIVRLAPAAKVLEGDRATGPAVLAALPHHEIVHFACHAVSEPADPAAARLQLSDHDVHPLDVGAISHLDLSHARVAYLSACATSSTSERLVDESVHITGAFLLAGFPGVVGTLWPVRDRAAARIAAAFYPCLLKGTPPAAALQRAIDERRKRVGTPPALWCAHVHVGL
ncbi:CHAT domain-containing protein [Actinomadura pelletieri]|uniref:CHAT domain-containing protein n=1 Tax=Actinomadura pelletieri TaxID=111805 RepID=UPI00147714B4|nr:CHAT domain-containing protein [Actinomadura pelletieri]